MIDWIKVSDRLPQEGQRVLATHEGNLNPNRQVYEHIFQSGSFLYNWHMDMDTHSDTFGQLYMGNVIAWSPYPEPYNETTED